MPIDIEGLKRKHGRDAKPQPKKPEQPIAKIVEPLIKEKKNDIKIKPETITEQEYKNKLINEILKKNKLKKGGNMTQQQRKKKATKGKSGLERAVNTKEQYDSLFGDNTEVREKSPSEANIGVNQPINNNNELMQLVGSLGANQGNNGSNNKDSGLIELKKMKLMKELFTSQQPQQQGGSSNNDMIKFMAMMMQQSSKNTELMMQNSDIKFAQVIQAVGGNQPNEVDVLMKGVELSRQLTGDNRAKSKDEMHYGIESKKLEIQEYARRDMLDREERVEIRDDQKSERFMNIGGAILDKVVGENLSTFVGDMMNAKSKDGGKGKSSKAPTSAQQDFDPSILDELND